MCSAKRELSAASGQRMVAACGAGLEESLHLASQPLTILRARFRAERVGEMDEAELRDCVERSCAQVECLCDVVNGMKHLQELSMVAPQCVALDVAALMADVVDAVGRVVVEAQIELVCVPPERPASMRADHSRMRQALSEALLLVASVSHASDTVRLEGSSNEDRATLTVSNAAATQDALRPRALISIASVETSVCSQGGAMTWSLNPFRIRLELPLTGAA